MSYAVSSVSSPSADIVTFPATLRISAAFRSIVNRCPDRPNVDDPEKSAMNNQRAWLDRSPWRPA